MNADPIVIGNLQFSTEMVVIIVSIAVFFVTNTYILKGLKSSMDRSNELKERQEGLLNQMHTDIQNLNAQYQLALKDISEKNTAEHNQIMNILKVMETRLEDHVQMEGKK